MKYYVYSESNLSHDTIKEIQQMEVAAVVREPVATKVFGNFSANEVDYFICPAYFFSVEPSDYVSLVKYLKYFKEKPERHIFFDLCDSQENSSVLCDSIVFKISARNGFGFYYPIPNAWCSWIMMEKIPSIKNCVYDVCFQGAQTHSIRYEINKIIEICNKNKLKTYLNIQKLYHYSLDYNERSISEASYYQSIIDSKFVLCPRGGSPSSVRIFETLAAGRIPVIISDDLILPLPDIGWDKFSIRVPEKDAHNTVFYIKKFLKYNNLEKSSNLAKIIWRKYFCTYGFSLKHFLDKSLKKIYI